MEKNPYEIAEGVDAGALRARVSALIAQGYEVVGGLSVATDGKLYQAMRLRAAKGTKNGEVRLSEKAT